MKIQIITLIIVLSFNLQSQNFPLQGNEMWYYKKITTYNNPSATFENNVIYYFDGDTIIQNDKWFKLKSRIYSKSNVSSDSYVNNIFKGYLQEKGKLWLLRNGRKVDTIYNSSLENGDKFFNNFTCIVEETLTDSNQRKIFKVKHSNIEYKTTLIEGIGYLYSYLGTPSCFECYSSQCHTAITLECFRQNGLNTYNRYCTQIDEINNLILQNTTSVSDSSVTGSSIKMHPNPTNTFLHIENLNQNLIEIKIYNSIGNIIYNSHLVAKLELDISAWPSGLYFVKVKNESYKLLKI